jgi:hypothetical protein
MAKIAAFVLLYGKMSLELEACAAILPPGPRHDMKYRVLVLCEVISVGTPIQILLGTSKWVL